MHTPSLTNKQNQRNPANMQSTLGILGQAVEALTALLSEKTGWNRMSRSPHQSLWPCQGKVTRHLNSPQLPQLNSSQLAMALKHILQASEEHILLAKAREFAREETVKVHGIAMDPP